MVSQVGSGGARPVVSPATCTDLPVALPVAVPTGFLRTVRGVAGTVSGSVHLCRLAEPADDLETDLDGPESDADELRGKDVTVGACPPRVEGGLDGAT